MRKIINFIIRCFGTQCNNCLTGRVYHSHTELMNRTWIEVYECDKCGNKFV